jgi:hypothetical protein
LKVLLDQGTPAPLRHELVGHVVTTAREMGWDQLRNGELLLAAEGTFDVFITTDQNLKYQQNLSDRRLAIVVLTTTSWPRIKVSIQRVRTAVDAVVPGAFVEVEIE